MYVYGIPCDAEHAGAAYLSAYGLLIFPAYTQPTCVQNHTMEALNPRFLKQFQAIVDHKGPLRVDLEDPYITEEEYALVKKLGACSWYYVTL
jgi:hypothetical protein